MLLAVAILSVASAAAAAPAAAGDVRQVRCDPPVDHVQWLRVSMTRPSWPAARLCARGRAVARGYFADGRIQDRERIWGYACVNRSTYYEGGVLTCRRSFGTRRVTVRFEWGL
jgi:hypothetical protein